MTLNHPYLASPFPLGSILWAIFENEHWASFEAYLRELGY